MITKTSCLTFIYSGVIMWKIGNNIRYKLMKSFRLISLHGTSEYKNSYHKHQGKHPNSFVDITCQLGNHTDNGCPYKRRALTTNIHQSKILSRLICRNYFRKIRTGQCLYSPIPTKIARIQNCNCVLRNMAKIVMQK